MKLHARQPRLARAIFAGWLAGGAFAASAGPPFLTDDPGPTDPGHWEIYSFVTGEGGQHRLGGDAGLDVNYGAAKGLQLTAVLPIGYQTRKPRAVGGADVELAVKYRFVEQREDSWRPDIAFFPDMTIPTGWKFSSTKMSFTLPIWMQKDVGGWSIFGGGGYTFARGRDERRYWTVSIAAERQVGERFRLGAEFYHHSRNSEDAGAVSGGNLGVTYRLTEHWSLMAAGGPQFEGISRRLTFYTSLKADY